MTIAAATFEREAPTTAPTALVDSAPSDARLQWAVFALVLVIAVAIINSLPVGVVYDDGMYVVLAKSIATGHGFRWLNLPGAPPATHFPPGYPAFLALLWTIFPKFPANVFLFKLANAVLTAIAGFLLFRFVRDRWRVSPVSSAVFALVAMLGIPTLTLSVMVMSEPLFLVLLLLALPLAERVAQSGGQRTWALLGLGVFIGVATLVRSHGVALIAALPLVLLGRRRFRDAALCGGAAVITILPWQLWASAHAHAVIPAMRGDYESYGAWLVEGLRMAGPGLLAHTVARTSAELASMFATLASPSMPAPGRGATLLALAVLFAMGVRPFWRRAPVTLLFLAFYLAIVLAWPFAPTRFVWGVWPLFLLPPMLGARELLTWRVSTPLAKASRVLLLASALLLALGYGQYTARGYRGRWWSSIARTNAASLRPLVLWARTHTNPGDLLAVEGESAVYLYADRHTVPVQTFTAVQYFRPRTPEENAAVIRDVIRAYPVNEVVLWSKTTKDAARVLATSQPPELAVRDTFPGGLVLVPAAGNSQ